MRKARHYRLRLMDLSLDLGYLDVRHRREVSLHLLVLEESVVDMRMLLLLLQLQKTMIMPVHKHQ